MAGWLSGLLAEVSLALGEEAAPHCVAALSLAREIGDRRLAGWVLGTRAQIALYTDDPRDSLGFARVGRQIAPRGSAALVRACTHDARTSARIGDRRSAETALRAAEHAWSTLAEPPARTIYSFGSSYFPYCAATTFVWLEDPVHAHIWASQAVELTDAEPEPAVSARVVVRVDLAVALALSGDAEGAATVGAEALDIWADRPTHPARKRIHQMLVTLQPFPEPCVTDLTERWRSISN